jgi:hypothetical protein
VRWLEAPARELFAVHLRTPLVLIGQRRDIELPQMVEELPRPLRFLRPFERQHFGAPGAHLRALDRVIVDKQEAVEPQVQLAGKRPEISRLVLPVDGGGSNVFAFQQEVGARLEDPPDVRFLVLAREADECSGLRQPRQRSL